MIISYLSLIFVTLASAVACGYLAGRRNANRKLWIALGFLLGPFALPLVLFAGSDVKEDGE